MSEIQSALLTGDKEELVRAGFSAIELEQLEQFFLPFCMTARVYLARIFLRAKVRKKTFREILTVCTVLWEEDWKHGTTGRIGDPDDIAPDGVGLRNTCAFFDAYRQLGMPFPKFLF